MRGGKRVCPNCLAKVSSGDTCTACGHHLSPLGSSGASTTPPAPDATAPTLGDDRLAAPVVGSFVRPAVPPVPPPPGPPATPGFSPAPAPARGPAPKAGWSQGQRLLLITTIGLALCLVVGGAAISLSRADERRSRSEAAERQAADDAAAEVAEEVAAADALERRRLQPLDSEDWCSEEPHRVLDLQPPHVPGEKGQYAAHDGSYVLLDDGRATGTEASIERTTLAVCSSPLEPVETARTCQYVQYATPGLTVGNTVPGTEVSLPVVLERERLEVYELATGKLIGAGEATASDDANCPDQAGIDDQRVTVRLTTQTDDWVAEHLAGGAFR